jgi:hypothetical protein
MTSRRWALWFVVLAGLTARPATRVSSVSSSITMVTETFHLKHVKE